MKSEIAEVAVRVFELAVLKIMAGAGRSEAYVLHPE